MTSAAPHKLPKTMNYSSLSVDDMIAITARLSELLLEENTLLAEMRIKELTPLQAEKLKLVQQIESFQRMVATDKSVVKTAEPERQDALISITDGLTHAIEENLRLTTVAKTINQRVMRMIVDGMAEQQRLGVYGSQGQKDPGADVTLSINLNERA